MRPAPAEGSPPLGDDEIEALLAPLAGAGGIAVAVSGGPDSLALLDCVDRWRRTPGRPKAVVLTVDHRLRAGSTREARAVAAVAGARGMDARILTRRGPRPKTGLEAAAREARYRLLVEAAVAADATHLVTAHHRDDQAETFLMRLARGTGVFGLAAMRPAVDAGPVVLVRPFLDVPSARLAATTAAAGLATVDDPMNADRRFLRARVRALMPLLASSGLDADRLSAIAARMAAAATAVDAAATALLASAAGSDALAVVSVDATAFASAPSDVRLRALVRLLLAIGGDDYAPRFSRLTALAEAIHARDGAARFKRTLAGVVIEQRGTRLVLYRELGRAGLATLPLRLGGTDIWDGRFRVSVDARAPRGLSLSALGEESGLPAKVRPGGVPAPAIAALPAVRRGGRLLAVPPLGWGDASVLRAVDVATITAERLARPPLFPDFLARG